jgi:histidine triad (HIT) family protein
MGMHCSFCKIVEGTADALILYEDDRIISFVPLKPAVTGHALIAPKAHYADLYSIPEELLSTLITACKTHALRWREQVGSTGINVLHASGADGEQSVFHFHFHLFPRFADDGLRTWPALPDVRQTREQMHAAFRLKP